MVTTTSVIEEFVPEPPTSAGGDVLFLSRGQIGIECRNHGARESHIVVTDARYIIPDAHWLTTVALEHFLQLKEHLFKKSPSDIYQKTIYSCNRFAIDFYLFLSHCHRLYWKDKTLEALAVGWGYRGGNNSPRIPIPQQQAVSLAFIKTPEDQFSVDVCALTPQEDDGAIICEPIDLHAVWFVHF